MTKAAAFVQNSRRKGDGKFQTALQMQNACLAPLQKGALSLTSTLDPVSALARVVEMTQTLSNSAHSRIFFYESLRKELTLAAS